MNPDNFSSKSTRLATPVRLGAAAVAACFLAIPVLANPVNPTVLNGTASFSQAGNVLTVTNSNGAIINWDKFSIQAGETTRFIQSSASSSVLNRVLNDPSVIYGTLSSNGKVWLVNPAGIMVGPGGRIDTAGFVASTLNISNDNFLAGRKLFENTPGAGNVVNQGEIRTPSGGSVYLIAPNVSNEGIINSPNGEVILAAGQTVSLIDSATPGVKVDITGAEGNATNLGTITAEAGRIGIAGVIVRNSGNLNASSVVADGGRIFLKATGDTLVEGGRLDASSALAKGGTIDILGDRVAVTGNTVIDASGATGGGYVRVGGDYQGKNPDIQNAKSTWFGADAVIKVDASDIGNGGRAIIWSDDTTRAYGRIYARGGSNGGSGGFVETSGKQRLSVDGIRVDTRGQGGTGTWLLDPASFVVTHISGGDISDSTINTNLQTTNVSISAAGDVVFNDDTVAISFPIGYPNYSLSFTAGGDIYLRGSITNDNYTTPPSYVTLNAGGSVITPSGANLTLGGTYQLDVQVTNGKTWNNYGTINVGGKADIALNTGTPATFHNKSGGIVNFSSTQGYAFQSPGDTGIVLNDGTINVTSGTAFEVKYNQGSGGLLNIANGQNLNLQNADSISGTVNLNATGALNINENHGIAATLSNLTFTGTGGTMSVGNGPSYSGKVVNLTNVNAPNVALTVGFVGYAGTINVLNGNSAFKTITFNGGSLGAMNNGMLGVTGGGLAIPNGATYTGNVGYVVSGNLGLGGALTVPGNLLLAAGWDGNFATLGTPATPGTGNVTLGTNAITSPGTVTLQSGASGGGISQAGGSVITANSLIASYGGVGSIGLGVGDNEVNYVTLTAPAGDVSYNSHRDFHLVSAVAGEAPGVAITTSPSGGKVFIGNITTANNRNVSVTAYGGIYDDNGSAINISTGSGNIVLDSLGGTPGNLAISADTATTGTLTALVPFVAGNSGGISVRNTSAAKPSTIDLRDLAASGNQVSFSHGGSDLALSPSDNFWVYNGGDLAIAALGNMTMTSGAPFINLQTSASSLLLVATGIMDFGSGNSFVMTNNDVGLVALTINVGSGSPFSAKNLGIVAGTLNLTGSTLTAANNVGIIAGNMVLNQGGIEATGGMLEAVIAHDIHLNNGSFLAAPSSEVKLTFAGVNSMLSLNDMAYPNASYILASPSTVHLNFLQRTSGGVVLDGVDSVTTTAPGSGFYTGGGPGSGRPLLKGAGLEIAYAVAGTSDLCATSSALCKTNDPNDSPIKDYVPRTFEKADAGSTEDSFGDKDEDKDKRDKNRTDGKDGKKEERHGHKRVAQCS